MGRDLTWYVLKDTEWVHDTDKKFCFAWDFEPDNLDVKESICARLDKDQKEDWYSTLDDENHPHWCPTCLTFASGLWNSPYVIHKKQIAHSCSNPIWGSEWNICNMHLGSISTPFLRLFRQDHLYSEVQPYHVIYSLQQVKEMGEPKRSSDKEACEETMDILHFLDEWTSQPGVRVIYESEV